MASKQPPTGRDRAQRAVAKTRPVRRKTGAVPPRRRLKRAVKWFLVVTVVTCVAAIVGVAGAYQHYVINNPGPHLERSHILSIINQESDVYYRDRTTRVGVFFTDEHRQFVPWDELPQEYVVAIVAAEDGTFWNHYGVSLKHIARAMWVNVREGGVVAGGSTLTQQTAKNLYYRPDRSLKAKLIELLNAMRLEAHFPKQDILTFYANQFHVSGNGRGLGIAARHFFDKEVDELSLLESAFIAGLVKAPSYYDPFIGDEERRTRSLERAHERTRYVLQRIVNEPAGNLAGPVPVGRVGVRERRLSDIQIMKQTASTLLETGFELEFRRGTFRFESSAVLDEVAKRLTEAPFPEVLEAAGIDDPADAGLVVVTTLDPDIQRAATYGLWHHLTDVGTLLEGLTVEDFIRTDGQGPRFDPDHVPQQYEFRLARVSAQAAANPEGQRELALDLGGNVCTVDRSGLVRASVAIHRGQKRDPNAKTDTAAVEALIDGLPAETVVWVSVRDITETGAVCDLEVRPELQGAAMVLQDGRVRAMVGGNDNRNFNRATALRQMGSTWKPLVFHAAMELGWNPDDVLDNRRGVFPFSTTFYYPRPDHAPEPEVSMSWAGVRSENLASIWLLYHVIDKLDEDEVAGLAVSLGLARGAEESLEDYKLRIQRAGVLPTPRRVGEAHFLQARSEVLRSIDSGEHAEDAVALQSLLYGWGFAGERSQVQRNGGSEMPMKLAALDHSWVHLTDRMQECKGQYLALEASLQVGELPDPEWIPDLSVWRTDGEVRVACGPAPVVGDPDDPEFVGYEVVSDNLLPSVDPEIEIEIEIEIEDAAEEEASQGPFGWFRKERRSEGRTRKTKPEPEIPLGPTLEEMGHMLVDGRLHYGTLERVEDGIERRRLLRDIAGEDAPGLYDPDVLYWHQDFRLLLGMKYVADLAHRYGVRNEVREILSLPLGASEITLEEVTSVYGGITSGQAWTYPGIARGGDTRRVEVATPQTPTLLIAEIRDVDGNLLYRAEPEPVDVGHPEVGEMTADILHNVVDWGTGRRARNAVEVDGVNVPLGGKTGTTNDYRNAAFVGFAPAAEGIGFGLGEGFSVGVYVGYDDNRSMSERGVRIAGSNGALPAWIGTVAAMAELGSLGKPVGAPRDGGWALAANPTLVRLAVNVDGGGTVASKEPVADATGPTLLTRAIAVAEPDVMVRFERDTRPIRVSPTTAEALDERSRGVRERVRKRLRGQGVWEEE